MNIQEKERAILNLYADNSELFDGIEHLIFNDLWSTDFNQKKYRIIKWNHENGKKSDIYLLANQLKKAGFNSKEIALETADANYRIAKNVDEYVKDIFNDWSKRKLKPLMHNIHSELNSDLSDVDSCIEDLKNTISEIESIKNNLSVEKSIYEIFDEALEDQIDLQNSGKKLAGYPTGLDDLDEIMNGLKNEMVVIGARPGMGKSSLIVNIITECGIKDKVPTIMFSLEMPRLQLVKNLWSNYLRINNRGIRKGFLSDEDMSRVKNMKNDLHENIIIDDTPAITYQYIESKIRKLRKKIPLNKTIVVLVDYLQLMKNTKDDSKGMSKEEQVGTRCNGLLELTKKYNLSMILLSQLSRDVEKRNPPRPMLSDLKESGAIEANAMQVLLLYRPEYYDKNAEEDGKSLKGICEINVAKNRYGETGFVYTKFKGEHSAFENFKKEDEF